MKFCGVTIQVKVTGVNHDVEILNIWRGESCMLWLTLIYSTNPMDEMLRNFIIKFFFYYSFRHI